MLPTDDEVVAMIAAAQSAADAGTVADDLASIAIGESRAMAMQRAGDDVAVLMLTRTGDGDHQQTGVFLHGHHAGRRETPGSLAGTAWPREAFDRPARRWPGRGAAIISMGGWAPGPTDGSTPTAPPDEWWMWVAGVAAGCVRAVEARSSIDTNRNIVEPRTGAFLVLVRARHADHLAYRGITADGRFMRLDVPDGSTPDPAW
ncbi:MAG: hypothetical protein H0V33_07955 [Acidimicrobiia bacterium]|nr:hypothetical protein [Acidimicrobiia bacterium]